MTSARPISPMRNFDPIRVGRCEKDCWVAYYRRKWFTLRRRLIGLVRATYGLSLLRATQASGPLVRAQMAFASEDNDVSTAIAYTQRFFAYISHIRGEHLDPREAALAEVSWWVVHRKYFGHSENPEVAGAVACAYAAVYRIDPAAVQDAARHRALAMVYSDSWVLSNQDPNSPLLKYEEKELIEAYTALKEAVS